MEQKEIHRVRPETLLKPLDPLEPIDCERWVYQIHCWIYQTLDRLGTPGSTRSWTDLEPQDLPQTGQIWLFISDAWLALRAARHCGAGPWRRRATPQVRAISAAEP